MNNRFKNILWVDLPAWLAICVALAIAVIYIFSIYPVSFVLGEGAYFHTGDAAQHVSGWQAFVADRWRFPLLKTELLSYPDGVSIAFTDSIPLVALLLKPFGFMLPEGFHYFGFWHAFSFVLQAVAAVTVMRAVGQKSLVSVLAAAFLFVTSSVMLQRAGHTALMTHALILFAMANYFSTYKANKSVDHGINVQLLLLLISFLIHPYLFAMNGVFLVALSVDAIRSKGYGLRRLLIKLAGALVAFMLVLYLCGYFGQASGALGFGIYSMNLSSPFCGGNLLSCPIDGTGGQGEGFAYLGAGVLLMAIIGLATSYKTLVNLISRHFVLFCLLCVLTLYALSNRVYLGDSLLFSYPVPGFLEPITKVFRASGRFVWVPFYFIILLALLSVLHHRNRSMVLVLLISACALQWYDLSPARAKIAAMSEKQSQIQTGPWSQLMEEVKGIAVVPPYECGSVDPEFMIRHQRLAADNGKYITSAYTARPSASCRDKSAYIENGVEDDVLYTLPDSMLAADEVGLPEGINASECVINHHAVLCVDGVDQPWWDSKGFYLPYNLEPSAYQGELIKHVTASELPSQTGKLVDGYLVNDGGTAGYLSYGPYLSLPSGVYRATISYASVPNGAGSKMAGRWDIVAGPGPGNRTYDITSGTLRPTNGTFTSRHIGFEIREETERLPLEVRVYLEEGQVMRLSSIEIARIRDTQYRLKQESGSEL